MKVSDNVLQFAKEFEGYEPIARQLKGDRKGIITGGYGTIIHPDGRPVKSGDIFTEEYALYCLKFEMDNKAKELNNLITKYSILLNQNQFDALADFAYNEGCGYFYPGHDLGDAMKNDNIQAIADALLLYNKGTKYILGIPYKTVLQGLVNRRKAERELFLKTV